ncbi:uncharacterized mitochondrial protein-like protein [Tanacetum coccineum]
MVTGESSQPLVKDTTLTFQCPILTSTNYTIWRMRMEVLLGIHGVWDAIDLGLADAKKNNTVKVSHAWKVMSKHKLVKKFLTSLSRSFIHIVATLEQVLDLKATGFEDVVGRLKVYEERIKKKDKADDSQENLLYARMDYSNRNSDSSRGRGRVSEIRLDTSYGDKWIWRIGVNFLGVRDKIKSIKIITINHIKCVSLTNEQLCIRRIGCSGYAGSGIDHYAFLVLS